VRALECLGVCFFFQAEDGIRDVAVTGVQTCALAHAGTAKKRLASKPSPNVPVSVCGLDALRARNVVKRTIRQHSRKVFAATVSAQPAS